MEVEYLPNSIRDTIIFKIEIWVYRTCNSFSLRGQHVVAEKPQDLELGNARFKCYFCFFQVCGKLGNFFHLCKPPFGHP